MEKIETSDYVRALSCSSSLYEPALQMYMALYGVSQEVAESVLIGQKK